MLSDEVATSATAEMYRLSSRREEVSSEEVSVRTLAGLVRDRHSILSHIGNTPLIRLRGASAAPDRAEIYAKAEWFNPGGSVKDRPALSMLLHAERTGRLTPDKTLIDATSGNTGIAYAMIGRVLGLHVRIVLPSNAGKERKQILRAYGAELLFTDPLAGTDGAQARVKEIVAGDPVRYFYPDQYNNPANWRAHYETTAAEIWQQTNGRITHFVAGLGTTGTFIGSARRLKELNPRITCIAVQPDSPLHGLEGLKHLTTAVVPGIYDPTVADEHIGVSTETAYAEVRRLARQEGLFVGVSGGAASAASTTIATRCRNAVIVTVFPDGGSRYAGERFWEDG